MYRQYGIDRRSVVQFGPFGNSQCAIQPHAIGRSHLDKFKMCHANSNTKLRIRQNHRWPACARRRQRLLGLRFRSRDTI